MTLIELPSAIAVIAFNLGSPICTCPGDAALTPAVTLVFAIPVLFKVVTGDGANSWPPAAFLAVRRPVNRAECDCARSCGRRRCGPRDFAYETPF
jgi:hypothetical protein